MVAPVGSSSDDEHPTITAAVNPAPATRNRRRPSPDRANPLAGESPSCSRAEVEENCGSSGCGTATHYEADDAERRQCDQRCGRPPLSARSLATSCTRGNYRAEITERTEPGAWWLPTPGMRPLTLAAASVAIYGCVPETDQMPRIWVLTFGAALAELVLRRRMPEGLLIVLGALVMWSGLYGATGRDSAIVGTFFSFWPVAIVPLVAFVRPVLRDMPETVQWNIASLGAIASVAVARTGALEPTIGPALLAVAIAAPLSFALALLVERAAEPRDDARS